MPSLHPILQELHAVVMRSTPASRKETAPGIMDRIEQSGESGLRLGNGSFGALLKVKVAPGAGATDTDMEMEPAEMAVKIVFNYGKATSKVEQHETQKEFSILRHMAVHRNIVRLMFECIVRPPQWMAK